MASLYDIFRWLLGGIAAPAAPVPTCDRIAVDQQQGGSNYPLVEPSEDVRPLILDFYLSYSDDDNRFELPFYIDWLYGFGDGDSESLSDVPYPANDQDVLIRDANDQIVFDSTRSNRLVSKAWGEGRTISEWTADDAVCRIVWCGAGVPITLPTSSSGGSSSGSSSSGSSSGSSASSSPVEPVDCDCCDDAPPPYWLVTLDFPFVPALSHTYSVPQLSSSGCTYQDVFLVGSTWYRITILMGGDCIDVRLEQQTGPSTWAPVDHWAIICTLHGDFITCRHTGHNNCGVEGDIPGWGSGSINSCSLERGV